MVAYMIWCPGEDQAVETDVGPQWYQPHGGEPGRERGRRGLQGGQEEAV